MKPKGYCYVEYQNEESVTEALKMTDIRIDGRKVIIKKSESDIKIRENLKFVAYITNLSYETKDKDLNSFFNNHEINGIKELMIVREEDGTSKGYGFAEFENEVKF